MRQRVPVVLVVEDQPQIARMIQRELAPHATVVVAGSAEEADARIGEHAGLTAAVCDLELGPGGSGVDVLRRLRQSHPHAARVVLSGVVPEELGPLMVSGLVQRYVAKPPRPGELWEAIQALVGSRA